MNKSAKDTKVLRINSIVDNPSPVESMYHLEKYNLLCVGRSDNTIEIWNSQTWVQLIKIYGLKTNSIRKVFMYKKEDSKNLFDNLRVFSIGTNGYLIEWCLTSLKPKIYYQNAGGCIWDFDLNKKVCLIACDDGSVRAVRIKKDQFVLEKQYSKTDSKVLSVKWSEDGDIFYTGLSNGTILKWDSSSGQVVATLNISSNKTTKKNNKMGTSTMIWTLVEYGRKFLFSGDSEGVLRVWDTQHGVLLKEFREHQGDILTTCKNNKFPTIYFTGADSLICAVELIKDEWILSSKFRGQSHDINSICLLNSNSLISGGMTTDICIYKLNNSRFIEKYDKKVATSVKRHISAFEQKTKIYVAQGKDEYLFILHRKLDKLNLWSVNENNMEKVTLLAEINKKNNSNIISANISSDSKYFAYSDEDNTVLFSYDYSTNDVKKIKTFKGLSSKFLFFSSNNTLVSLDNENRKVNIYHIKTELTEVISLNQMSKNEVVLSCDINEDKFLAFATLDKKLYLVNLKKLSSESSLPCADIFTTQLKFINNNLLLTVCEDNRFFIVDLKNQKFSDWTNKNINNFPKNYLSWYNKIMGVAHQFDEKDSFCLYTDYNYIKVDLTKEIPQNSTIFRDKNDKTRNAEWNKKIRDFHKDVFNKTYKEMKNTEVEAEVFKDKEESHAFENDNFKITSRFSSILFMDYLLIQKDSRVLLVVENDWNKILKEFPDTIAKFNYGH